jgi:RimJ/RimL family protein N-acetyltransferase
MILTTSRPGVTLRELTRSDAPALFALIQANRSHLTAHGDYADQVAARVEDIATELAMEPTRHKRFGILSAGQLIGRVDLIGAEPPRYSLGYWLAASHVGKGIAKAAVGSIVDFAFAQCGASDIFAGVTHGNERSASLLRRLEFHAVGRFDTYTRFHRGAA